MTGSKLDSYGNSKLISFGFKDQGLKLVKDGQRIEVNVFGVTLGIYNSIEELYKFGIQSKNTVQRALEHVQSTLKDDEYIEELKQAIEDSRGMKGVHSANMKPQMEESKMTAQQMQRANNQ